MVTLTLPARETARLDGTEIACWKALNGCTGRSGQPKTRAQQAALVAGWCLTGYISVKQAEEFAEVLGLDWLGLYD